MINRFNFDCSIIRIKVTHPTLYTKIQCTKILVLSLNDKYLQINNHYLIYLYIIYFTYLDLF